MTVESVSPSRTTREAQKRLLRIAESVGEREAWKLESANVDQEWVLRLAGKRWRIHACVSLFVEGRRGLPGVVFGLSAWSTSRKVTRDDFLRTRWFEGFRARVGAEYTLDEPRGDGTRTSLFRILRGTTDPSRVLLELADLEMAITTRNVSTRKVRPVS